MKKYIREEEWRVVEDRFDPDLHPSSESLFSIGNGKMGQRANFEEAYSGKSLQGSYCAGIYYPDKTKVGWWKNGYPEYFAKVINSCNWIGIDVQIDGEILDFAKLAEISQFERVLDMRDATLSRSARLTLVNGAEISLKSRRFLSLPEDELGLIRYEIRAENRPMEINIAPYLDGAVRNQDANYGEHFWEKVAEDINSDFGMIVMRTKKLDFHVGFAFRSKLYIDDQAFDAPVELLKQNSLVGQCYAIRLQAGQSLRLEKYCAVISSRDEAVEDLPKLVKAKSAAAMAKGFDQLLAEQQQYWQEKWRHMDIQIDGDVAAQQAIRFNILQLNQTYTGRDPRLNIGPKGFTGEKYGGSTYWDTEAYCLPFYLSTAPAHVAKQLLLYRYRHLGRAIENAEKLGFSGGAALYPMVTMNGEECHNEWEITFEEIHRNGAIAYAIFNYIRYTGDENYIKQAGLEVLVAIARFWAQRVNWSEPKQKYVMLGVTGPNEYENNVNNNWYTNYIAAWCLRYAEESLQNIEASDSQAYWQLTSQLSIEPSERQLWQRIDQHMFYPESSELGVYLQQESYLDKELKNADELAPSERPINQYWSWDRILRSCFIKQADTLQGFYFFEDHFDMEQHRAHFAFYEPKTVHESSLSPCVHAILASKIGNIDKAYELYLRTSRLDLDDYNDEVHEGLHITSMAGTWMSMVQGFGGMRVRDDQLCFAPQLPKSWHGLQFFTMFRDRTLRVQIAAGSVEVEQLEGKPLSLQVYDKQYELAIGQSVKHLN